jgi:NADPH:quinone reductase-like Zn-dependent oxidoreductase
MQAVVMREYGGPEVLTPETVADPVPVGDEVVVELRYCALNYHDVLAREGGLGVPLPRILGIDGAGINRDSGEEVVILPSLGWGDDPSAPGAAWHILGDRTDGTYAELVTVPAENVFPKPSRLSWAEAAALPVGGLTAHRALFSRGSLDKGETALVLGSGSGVSTFAVSLAAAAGAKVFVTSSSTEKIQRARELGASDGVLYTDGNWVQHALSMTSGGVDLVIDSVGRDLESSLRCTKAGGRVVTFGAPVGTRASFDLRPFYFSQRSIVGSTLGNAAEFAALLDSVGTGTWRPVIDSEWSLADLSDAHRHLESKQHFGKVVVRCG